MCEVIVLEVLAIIDGSRSVSHRNYNYMQLSKRPYLLQRMQAQMGETEC